MALPPAFLDELRARTPLPGLIGRKTRLLKSGRNWKGCCPFHGEKTPSFYVYDDHFHCFGCGAHGDAISFIMRAEGAAFPEAVERLAAEAGLEVPKPTAQEAARERRARDLHAVMAAAAEAYHRRLFLPEGRPALDYLLKRGLTEATIRAFMLGWAPSGRGAIAADLRGEEITEDQLVEAGLLRPGEAGEPARDFFYARVMFPIRDRRGRVIAFGGRILGDGQPKYVNSPETPLFTKRRTLFGIDKAREAGFRGRAILVVEGYLDVIALHQAGFDGAVAPLGTSLTEEHLHELWMMSPEPVLCFDGDAAGERALERTISTALPSASIEKTIRAIQLGNGLDPDDFLKKHSAKKFEEVLSSSLLMHEYLFSLSKKSRILHEPSQIASWETQHEGWAAKAQNPEYKRFLRTYFREARRAYLGMLRAAERHKKTFSFPKLLWRTPGHFAHRRGLSAEQLAAEARVERARIFLAIILRHSWLVDDLDEAIGIADLPAGLASDIRAGILAWAGGAARRIDSADLIAHLHQAGLGDAVSWALSSVALPRAALEDSSPSETAEGFWHFFHALRDESALIRDQQEAMQILVGTNDRKAELRLKAVTQALAAVRRCEIVEHYDEAA